MLAFPAAVAPVAPHSISVIRGTVEVGRAETVVAVETDHLLHSVEARGDATLALTRAAAQQEAALLDELVVRDAAGERLAGRIVSTQLDDDRAVVRIAYTTDAPPRYLTFQQTPAGFAPGPPRQLALAIRGADEASPRAVLLTSRGNSETLRFEWGSDAETAPEDPAARCGQVAIHEASIQPVIRIEDAGVRIETHVPLPLLETWLALPRADRDFVEIEEQADLRDRLLEFFSARDRVLIDGRLTQPRGTTVAFAGLDDLERNAARAPRRVSAWSGRVVVTRSFPAAEPPRAVSIVWDLFNGAVLTADACLIADDRCTRHRLSTYAPRLDWSR